MNSWMHLRYWSSVGLLPARGPGWPAGASASRISSAMRARRSLGEAPDEPRPTPPPCRVPLRPRPRPRPRSQRDDVGVGLLDRDAQRVLLLVVQGMLVSSPLQEQADLTGGGRGQVGAGQGQTKATPWPGPHRGQEGRRRLTPCVPGAWRGAGAPGPGCLFGSRLLRFAEGIHRQSRSPGDGGQFRLTWEMALCWLPGGYQGSPCWRHMKESSEDAPVSHAASPRPPLTPNTACTNGVLPSSSASAQLTSAPCASAVASAGRSRVRAARCARSPGCSSRTSARPQASASPSASPLDSSDSAPSKGRG